MTRSQAEITPVEIRDLVGTAPTILEIGCNDGTDTLTFLEAMPDATIHCFEPDPRAIARFKDTVKDPRVTLTEAAVADICGYASFNGSSGQVPEHQRQREYACHFLPEWDLSGSLRKATGHLERSSWTTFPEDRVTEVRVITLDHWMKDHPEIASVDFIWADVQGAEDSVIRGAARTLAKTRYFYTEFSDTPLYENQVPLAIIYSMLPDFDFRGVYGENALFRNRKLAC